MWNISSKYKDFYQLSFGINLVRSPDATEIRKGGRAACNLSLHFDIIPNPLEFSILFCGGVCHKLQTYNCEKIIQEWKKHSKSIDIIGILMPFKWSINFVIYSK